MAVQGAVAVPRDVRCVVERRDAIDPQDAGAGLGGVKQLIENRCRRLSEHQQASSNLSDNSHLAFIYMLQL